MFKNGLYRINKGLTANWKGLKQVYQGCIKDFMRVEQGFKKCLTCFKHKFNNVYQDLIEDLRKV